MMSMFFVRNGQWLVKMRASDVKFTGYVARMLKVFEILVLMGTWFIVSDNDDKPSVRFQSFMGWKVHHFDISAYAIKQI